METVIFRNKDMYWDIAADIHFPPAFDVAEAYPAIIAAHPIGSCKEQTSGVVYGAALAREGFVVIAFDRSFQGASGGEPRYIEDPVQAVEDFRRVSDYLMTLPYVDANRIGVLGICGGGGYAINAAMTERRIKAVGTVSAANYGSYIRRASDNDPIAALNAMAAQRTAEARGAEFHVNDPMPPSLEPLRAAGITKGEVFEAVEYYRTPRGQKPHGLNRAMMSHQASAAGWDAFHLAEVLLTQPLLVIAGNKVGPVGSYNDSCEIVERAASTDKELVVVEGASHFDLYDQPEPTAIALDKLVPFYRAKLAA